MKSLFIIFILAAGITTSYAQTGNTGIGTTTPITKLDVNGGITAREGAPITVTGNTATIPNLQYSQYRLDGSPASAFTITGPTTSNGTTALAGGARLIVVNATTQPGVLNGSTIVPGSAQEFTYSNNSWVAIRNPGTAIGFFASSAGTQSLAPGAFPHLTDWAITKNDFGAAYSGGVYTVPSGMQGWYSISTAFRQNGGCSYNNAAYIQVNEVTVALGNGYLGVNGGQVNSQIPNVGSAVASVNYYLNAGDRVRIVVNAVSYSCSNPGTQVNTTALPGYTYFSLLRYM